MAGRVHITIACAEQTGHRTGSLIRWTPPAKPAMLRTHFAPVAQLDRVLPSEGRGRTFESCRARHIIKELGRHLAAFFLTYGKYTEISVLWSVKTDA